MASRPEPTQQHARRRQLVWYFGGLVAVYLASLAFFWPEGDEQPSDGMFLLVMFAPTVGALLARFLAGGSIQWGRPSPWILAGLIPAAAALGAYLLGAALGWDAEDPTVLRAALVAAPGAIALASLSAVGEEIGWRGFLWPTLRHRWSFLRTSAVLAAVWWLYHVPFIVFGWYGSLSGIPAFTVALIGFTLFVGVLTDRSRSVWPSVVAHGAWNGLVATSFAATEGDTDVPAFTGSEALLGEFGWLAAGSSLLVGGLAAWWHRSSGRAEPDRGS